MSNNKNYDAFKNQLEAMQRENDHTLSTLHEGIEQSETESIGTLSAYDNHPADEGTELSERTKDRTLIAHFQEEQAHIVEALTAIESGTYGYCKVCHKEIPLERLKTIPQTLYCVKHTPEQTITNIRSLEEDVLGIPFVTYNNDFADANFFDAEDAWQNVASSGTSDTPSDFNEDIENYSRTYLNSGEIIGSIDEFEEYIGTDMYGKNPKLYSSKKIEKFEHDLDNHDENMYGSILDEE